MCKCPQAAPSGKWLRKQVGTCAKAPSTASQWRCRRRISRLKEGNLLYIRPNPPPEIIIAIVGKIDQDYPWHLFWSTSAVISAIPQDYLCTLLKVTFEISASYKFRMNLEIQITYLCFKIHIYKKKISNLDHRKIPSSPMIMVGDLFKDVHYGSSPD